MSDRATRLIEEMESEFGRFETSENTMTALIGAMVLALNGRDFSNPGTNFVAGLISQEKASQSGRMREELNNFIGDILLAGISPDSLRDILK